MSVKNYCVSMINKIIHGSLKIWNFSSRVRLDTRSLRSLASYRIKHSKRNFISTRAHVLFSVYEYEPLMLHVCAHMGSAKSYRLVILQNMCESK